MTDNKGVASAISHSAQTQPSAPPATAAAAATAGEGKKGKGSSNPAITAMYADVSQSLLVSGAKDGSVVLWRVEADLTHTPIAIRSFSIANTNPSASASPRGSSAVSLSHFYSKQIQSVCTYPQAEPGAPATIKILISSRGCDIFEVVCPLANSTQQVELSSVVMRGHCNDELWGLGTHPRLPVYCTVGDDKTMRIFDLHSREMLAMTVRSTNHDKETEKKEE